MTVARKVLDRLILENERQKTPEEIEAHDLGNDLNAIFMQNGTARLLKRPEPFPDYPEHLETEIQGKIREFSATKDTVGKINYMRSVLKRPIKEEDETANKNVVSLRDYRMAKGMPAPADRAIVTRNQYAGAEHYDNASLIHGDEVWAKLATAHAKGKLSYDELNSGVEYTNLSNPHTRLGALKGFADKHNIDVSTPALDQHISDLLSHPDQKYRSTVRRLINDAHAVGKGIDPNAG